MRRSREVEVSTVFCIRGVYEGFEWWNVYVYVYFEFWRVIDKVTELMELIDW